MKILPMIVATIFSLPIYASDYHLREGDAAFQHNRPDLTLERLWIQLACFDDTGAWTSEDCIKVSVDGVEHTGGLIDLEASSNQVDIPDISIRFEGALGGFFCVGMKVLFKGFPNRCDSLLYPPYPDPRSRDRYSLLSFCSAKAIPDGSSANSRFSNRRKATWETFAHSLLAQPIRMQLTNTNPKACD